MKHLYSFLVIAFFSILIGCEDDSKFSITPSLGFLRSASTVAQTSEDGVDVKFYSNITLTEPVTIRVQITGGEYETDYITVPESNNGIITVTVDPADDEAASFSVFPIETGEELVKVRFEIIEVQGNGLRLGQPTSLVHDLSITDSEVLPPDTETIAALRARFTGAQVNITENIFIEGVVTSSNDNVTAKSVYIQDASAAIVLRLVEDNLQTFKRGDRVRVSLQGTNINAFRGLVQVNMPKAKGTVMGTASLPSPRVITIAQLNAKTYESQLVRIAGVSFAAANGTVTVSGNTTFSDGSASGIMRVETYSPFVNKILPQGSVTITGLASVFDTGQLIPQIATDIP